MTYTWNRCGWDVSGNFINFQRTHLRTEWKRESHSIALSIGELTHFGWMDEDISKWWIFWWYLVIAMHFQNAGIAVVMSVWRVNSDEALSENTDVSSTTPKSVQELWMPEVAWRWNGKRTYFFFEGHAIHTSLNRLPLRMCFTRSRCLHVEWAGRRTQRVHENFISTILVNIEVYLWQAEIMYMSAWCITEVFEMNCTGLGSFIAVSNSDLRAAMPIVHENISVKHQQNINAVPFSTSLIHLDIWRGRMWNCCA